MNCPKCGKEVSGNTRFCTHCGSPIGEAAPPVNQSAPPSGQPYSSQGQVPPYQSNTPQGGYAMAEKKSPLVPILIAVGAVALIGVGILLFILLSKGDSSNTGTDNNIVADGGSDIGLPAPGQESTAEPTATPEPEPTATPEPTPEPTPTPYIAKLGIENSIRLNRVTSFSGIEQLKYYKLFNKRGKMVDVPVRVKLKCKRRSIGKRYKLTCTVIYRFTSNPKVNRPEMARIKGYGRKKTEHIFRSQEFFTVFDYRTGKCLEGNNKHRVKTKSGRWRYKFYNKQRYDTSSHWYTWKNRKQLRFSFAVSYPKSYEDLCLGVGFYNKYDDATSRADNRYWKGKCALGKTQLYRRGKDSTAFLIPE